MDTKNSPNTKEKLFSEFPAVTTAEWEAVIAADLKGADYAKKLIWKTDEGFTVKPYYREEDLASIQHLKCQPGQYPFVRGTKTTNNKWFIRQDLEITQENLSQMNEKAVGLLTKGVDSFGFIFKQEETFSYEDFKTLLKNIPLATTEINFVAGHQAAPLYNYLDQYIKEHNLENDLVRGSLGFAPLAYLTLNGKFCRQCQEASTAFDQAADLVGKCKPYKGLSALSVDSLSLANAGATASQELGFALSQGVEYLHQLTDRNLEAGLVAQKIKFEMGAGPNYFIEIAKLRAARMLWAKIVRNFGVENEADCKMRIHTTTLEWNLTLYDPYVNMLRTTTESMSAVIAGTDSHTVLPFDSAFGQATEFSERIARNQQLVLKEESNFDKLVDPSAGSYYIESITAAIADEAWKLFLKTEDEGGYFCALRKGFVQDQIEATARKRDQALALRRDILLGTNQYPNFSEKMTRDLDEAILRQDNTPGSPDLITSPLRTYRGAAAFEAMRYRTDKFAKDNHRPKAFMLTIGNFGMRKARAQFACNFFACAGFEVIDNNGFKTAEEGVKAALDAKAEFTVICSSDDEYATLAPEIFEKIAGKSVVVIAGNPPSADELKTAGIKHFIHVKSNVLETLQGFQTEAGIL